MTLHYTENLQASEAWTFAVNTAVCPPNHLTIAVMARWLAGQAAVLTAEITAVRYVVCVNTRIGSLVIT